LKPGLGDYTEERQNFIGNMNLDETVSEIKKMKESLLNKKLHSKRKKVAVPFSRHTRSSLKTKIN